MGRACAALLRDAGFQVGIRYRRDGPSACPSGLGWNAVGGGPGDSWNRPAAPAAVARGARTRPDILRQSDRDGAVRRPAGLRGSLEVLLPPGIPGEDGAIRAGRAL